MSLVLGLRIIVVICAVVALIIAIKHGPYIEAPTGLERGRTLAAAGVVATIGLGVALLSFVL